MQMAQWPGLCKLPKPPGGGGKPSFPSPSAGDLRELPGVEGKGLMLRRRWNHVVFLELWRDSRVMMGISGFLLCWPWEAQSSPRVARECSGGLRPPVELCVEHAGLCGRCTGVAVPLRPAPTAGTSLGLGSDPGLARSWGFLNAGRRPWARGSLKSPS